MHRAVEPMALPQPQPVTTGGLPAEQPRVITLAVVGDVHDQWGEDSEAALASLGADVAVFVGDFGNEDVELVQAVAAVAHPKVVVLGNHDAWYSLTARGRQRAVRVALMSSSLRALRNGTTSGVADQLAALGPDHIGFAARHYPSLPLSFVGGRAFSKGGRSWDEVAQFYAQHYGVSSFRDSAQRVVRAALAQPAGAPLVVVAHNGPTGLGERRCAPCGVDWQEPEGDHGDPDLQDALESMAVHGRPAALVLFGHMHHTLKGGGRRNMAHVDAATGTVYLNAAVVPRIRSFPAPSSAGHAAAANGTGAVTQGNGAAAGGRDTAAGGGAPQATQRGHHFLLVQLQGGAVIAARHAWVATPSAFCAGLAGQGAHSRHGGAGTEGGNDDPRPPTSPVILDQEEVIKSTAAGDGSGLVYSYYRAHTREWAPVVVRAAAAALAARSRVARLQ